VVGLGLLGRAGGFLPGADREEKGDPRVERDRAASDSLPRCGAVSRSDVSGVSIRSALFALKKIGAVTEAEHEALDKSWRKFQTRNRLDACGRKVEPTQNTDGEGSDSCC
jgi:hypothetical protein